ncbi:hypothetical protein GPECTOR_28g852 [Gonium pectorale]|uniref:Uncharacterized protein n=1 Tax=Gonium pectorale TaxID=33097 RepID=A0A150GF24_GONPE|nr:hypothetical protein GPECTOR_28g852 [Gonium pectorale]|eukprot:KXZ48442.1 hypothetical protein GPECTOR_28g852 [Gonium pectorale]
MSSHDLDTRLGLVLVALLLGTAGTSDGAPEKAAAFMKCFEKQDCLAKRTAWEHFTEDLPSCLAAARVWWSSKPVGTAVTLVTQLSAERLDQLKAQCATWQGPLAAALYLPIHNPSPHELAPAARQKLQAMVASADEFFRQSEKPGGPNGTTFACQLRLVLIYELFVEPSATVLYPVNSLRNYARLLADTDLITNIDVDMIPSTSISAALSTPATLTDYTRACRRGAVYVWPAFETHCGAPSYADEIAKGDKELVTSALKKCLRRMRPKAPYSHNATNYDMWLTSDRAYQIQYSPLFEPWFLSWRWGTLWYDYRYRGYGKNKIVQAAAMNNIGTSWYVSPHGFLVHRKHTDSKARRDFLKAKFSKKDMQDLQRTVYGHVEALWNTTRHQLQSRSYLARVEPHFQACMASLPWWQRAGVV